jgi:tetratricopeptide (TPR) repeat protein
MKSIFQFLIFIAAVRGMAAAQPTFADKALDMPGAYRKTAHEPSRTISRSENNKTIQMMDAVVDAFRKYYPQPIGADVGPYASLWETYRDPSEVAYRPYTIMVTIPFYDLYKVKPEGTEATGEYASSMEIWINAVWFLLQGNYVHNGNGRIYRAPWPGIPVHGFPKYNNMILILPPGKALPWRPATREEYLENYIASIRKVTPFTSYDRDKIAAAEQLLASMSSSERKQIAYLKKAKYPNCEFGDHRWTGFLNPSDSTADQLVITEENFYDQTLPRASFQAIVIERRHGPGPNPAVVPNPDEVASFKARRNRLDNIVRNTEFLPALQQLMGKGGMLQTGARKNPSDSNYVVKKIDRRNIDRIVDSLFRNYTVNLPSTPGVSTTNVDNSPPPELPARKEKKLVLASRKLETKEEVVQYLDELDRKLAPVLETPVTAYGDAHSNNMAAYGYWLMNKPGQSLLLALRAAKQQPDNDCMLNNLGANLSVCGIDYMAVPLYIVCLKKEPANSTITNNLGQSYLAMGDVQNAEIYLRQSIAATPYHHHANNSLGIIYEKQGRKNEAIRCYENSLRGSFTLSGYNGLRRLKPEAALKLMNYIKHRYRQPDYLNFNKYIPPRQCLNIDEIASRKEEHKDYRRMLDALIQKFNALRAQQSPLAAAEGKELPKRAREGKQVVRPFQPFAYAMLLSVQSDYEDKMFQLKKDLIALEKQNVGLKLEFDTVMRLTVAEFETRSDKVGEGNGDPTLEEDICNARNAVVNHYLLLFADNNEQRFNKILHAYKDYLNDYLYWVRLASPGEQAYRLAYDDLVLAMIKVLKEVRLTTLDGYCGEEEAQQAKEQSMEIKEPYCPLPIGVEIPLVIGKIGLDCESWGLELGEGIVLNIDHKFGGETTIAIGPGETFYTTPKITGKTSALNPGVDVNAKGQVFLTFEGSTVVDGGFLWEAEVDIKGLGKPAELKQNFTWAVNKGFTYEGQLTTLGDRIFGIPPETQANKNVKIYKPDH